MNCKRIHSKLIFYLDNELSDQMMNEVRRHLNECADCRQFAGILKLQMQLIDNEKRPEVTPNLFTRISARLDERNDPGKLIALRWLQAAAFTILLLAAIIGGIYIGTTVSDLATMPTDYNNLLLMNDFEAEPLETFLLDQQ